MTDTSMQNKKKVWEMYLKLSAVASNQNEVAKVLKDYLQEDVLMHACHPLNEQKGLPSVYENVWKPFFTAFPDAERVTNIFLAGNHKGEDWVSASGHFIATFKNVWLGMNPSDQMITIRFGEYFKFEEGKITETYLMFDVLDVMRQINSWPVGFSYGKEDWWPKSVSGTGIILQAQDQEETKQSIHLHNAWLAQLDAFLDDTSDLSTLEAEKFLHPRYMQYASSGFGASRAIQGVHENFHQPFLHAFKQRKFGAHQLRIAEGAYLSSCGWQSIRGVHEGELFNFAGTNKRVKLRAMDWWRRAGDKMRESWVMIDMLDLFSQLDIDLYAKMLTEQDQKSWL